MIYSNELNELVNALAETYKKILAGDNINASSRLSDSVSADFEYSGSSFRVWFNIEDHWKYVEEGRKPGKFPPMDAIEEWIRIKPIIPDARSGTTPNPRQLAFMISRKIAREGTEGKHPLDRAIKSSEGQDIIKQIKDKLTELLIYENIR